MRNLLVRIIISAIAIGVTAAILPGIIITDNNIFVYLLIGAIFGIVNAFVKPILKLLSCPMILLTLGLFILVINGLMLQLTAWIVGDAFQVDGIGWAIIGGIVMSIVVMILESILGVDEGEPVKVS